MRPYPLLSALFLVVSLQTFAAPVTTTQEDTRLTIHLGEQTIATYVWHDDALPRPYFENFFTPDGTLVTRTHPTDPVRDKGNDDHPDFHPGAWLAFGDINGADFWRNKARVRHLRFVTPPTATGDGVTFTVLNAYERTADTPQTLCEETCTYTLTPHGTGYLLTATSTFRPTHGPIAFGDQEEMGFGVRLATPFSVRHGGGFIRNSAGGKQEAGTWGKNADWCAGFGKHDDTWVGVNVMASPDNFRPAWFHSRDYGLIVANPFGKKAMTGPKDDTVAPDQTPVAAGEALTITFGLYIFQSAEAQPDFDAMYQRFLKATR